MNSLYPWIMLLIVVPAQLYLVYYLPKRFRKEPLWAQLVVSVIFFSQIPMICINIYNIWRYFS